MTSEKDNYWYRLGIEIGNLKELHNHIRNILYSTHGKSHPLYKIFRNDNIWLPIQSGLDDLVCRDYARSINYLESINPRVGITNVFYSLSDVKYDIKGTRFAERIKPLPKRFMYDSKETMIKYIVEVKRFITKLNEDDKLNKHKNLNEGKKRMMRGLERLEEMVYF
jgi:hypothetical protein